MAEGLARNTVEFQAYGDYALFTDPITRIGGEKCTYMVPTYEAIKGILHSIYFKPTITWIVDEVRVMNRIQTESKGVRPIKYNDAGKNDLSYYTYLKDCCYQVRAHFVWNLNHPELEQDRNENKHHNIAKRMIARGGRRDIFLGVREAQGYVEPCVFGTGDGAYDQIEELRFGRMYHGITYADEAYSEETAGKMSIRFWNDAVMKKGIIRFPSPESFQGTDIRIIRSMDVKKFGKNQNNFIGLAEFEGGDGHVMDDEGAGNL
jgi:CRISPR-associated protein Cas5d